jgi:hypothetical protein
MESESDYCNPACKSGGDKPILSITTSEFFNGIGIDLQSDVTASVVISQEPPTEMLLMDPDLILQNLLNSCYRWNSVGQW